MRADLAGAPMLDWPVVPGGDKMWYRAAADLIARGPLSLTDAPRRLNDAPQNLVVEPWSLNDAAPSFDVEAPNLTREPPILVG